VVEVFCALVLLFSMVTFSIVARVVGFPTIESVLL